MKYSLVGVDGNAFAVMGYVLRAMRECHLGNDEQKSYQKRAMSEDYNNLLRESVAMIYKCNEIIGGNDEIES